MDRWLDMEDHGLPRQPCPGCGTPHGGSHRDRCIKGPGELHRRLRESLHTRDGFRRAVAVLVDLPVAAIMAGEGLPADRLGEAVADVLLETLGPPPSTPEPLEGLEEILERWSAHIINRPATSSDLEARQVLRCLATAAYEVGLRAREPVGV